MMIDFEWGHLFFLPFLFLLLGFDVEGASVGGVGGRATLPDPAFELPGLTAAAVWVSEASGVVIPAAGTWCDDGALLMLSVALTDMKTTRDEQQSPDSSLVASSDGLLAAAVSLAAASCEESPLLCPTCAGPLSASCCPFALDSTSAAILAAASCAPSALSDAADAGALSPSCCPLESAAATSCVAPALLGSGSVSMRRASCRPPDLVAALAAASCPASASLCPASAGRRSACCCAGALPAPCRPVLAAGPPCGGAPGAASAAMPALLGSGSGLLAPALAAGCDD